VHTAPAPLPAPRAEPAPGGAGPAAAGEAPPPSGEAALTGCRPTPVWTDPGEDLRTLSGQLTYSGSTSGPLLIDVINADGVIVWGVECSRAATFSLQIPARLTEVWLAAYLDPTGDGPSASDPQGRSPGLTPGAGDVADLQVEVTDGGKVDGVISAAPAAAPPAEGGPGPAGSGEPAAGSGPPGSGPAGSGPPGSGPPGSAGDGQLPPGDGPPGSGGMGDPSADG
jgi:hypothetical protein